VPHPQSGDAKADARLAHHRDEFELSSDAHLAKAGDLNRMHRFIEAAAADRAGLGCNAVGKIHALTLHPRVASGQSET